MHSLVELLLSGERFRGSFTVLKDVQPTSAPLTMQGPWIDLSSSYPMCLLSSSFLKCKVALMSCTPCQTTKPACPNKSTLLWLSSPGVLIHVLLPLGLGAQACLRNWMAASFPAKTIANIFGNKERESLIVKCLTLAFVWSFCQRIPEISFRYRDPKEPSNAQQ